VVQASSQATSTDTVIIRETLRDTLIRIERDSSMVRALVECDSTGRAYLKELLQYQAGERLKPPRITLQDNVLTATASADSMAIYLTLKDRYEHKISDKSETETVVVEVNKLTRWQTFWMMLGRICAVVISLWLILLLLTKFTSIKIPYVNK